MEKMDLNKLAVLLEQAGLRVEPQVLEQLLPLSELHAKQLEILHAIDVGEEEPASGFRPEWTLE